MVHIFLFSPVGKIDIGHVRLNFWDLGGQEELQSLWDKVSGGGRGSCVKGNRERIGSKRNFVDY